MVFFVFLRLFRGHWVLEAAVIPPKIPSYNLVINSVVAGNPVRLSEWRQGPNRCIKLIVYLPSMDHFGEGLVTGWTTIALGPWDFMLMHLRILTK